MEVVQLLHGKSCTGHIRRGDILDRRIQQSDVNLRLPVRNNKVHWSRLKLPIDSKYPTINDEHGNLMDVADGVHVMVPCAEILLLQLCRSISTLRVRGVGWSDYTRLKPRFLV